MFEGGIITKIGDDNCFVASGAIAIEEQSVIVGVINKSCILINRGIPQGKLRLIDNS